MLTTLDNTGDKLLIQQILTGDDTILKEMYPRYQKNFMGNIRRAWSKTFDEKSLEEAYLQAMSCFYIQVKNKKLTELKYSVNSYLFAIGRYWLIKEAKRLNRTLPFGELGKEPADEEMSGDEFKMSDLDEERKTRMRQAMAQLRKKCRQLLTLSIAENKSTEEIMEEMGYANSNTVYAAKARCIKELKDLIKK